MREVRRNWQIYLFIAPVFIYLMVFKYYPIYFVQIAFRNYRITRSVLDSPWVGFANFMTMFDTPGFFDALTNSILISIYKLLAGFPMPIILALLLNEMNSLRFKRITQTAIYLPHFISWAIISGIMYNLLSVDGGVINNVIRAFGGKEIYFLGDPKYYRTILVLSNMWKEAGWGTILYLAAITNIDPSLYEAATVDGANRWQRLWHITIAGIRSTIVVLFIIRLGHVLDAGFEQAMALNNTMVRSVGDILDTFVYRIGLEEGKYTIATAAGLFKTAVAAVLVLSSDKVAKKLGESGLF